MYVIAPAPPGKLRSEVGVVIFLETKANLLYIKRL